MSVTDEEVLRQVTGRTSSARDVVRRLGLSPEHIEPIELTLEKFFEVGKVVRYNGSGGEFSYLAS